MKLLIRLLGITILIGSLSTIASAQTAEEIVAKYLDALGGRATLAKLESRHVVGTVALTTPAGAVPGTAEVFSQAPNKSRTLLKIDLSAFGQGELTMDQRFDGESAVAIDSRQGGRDITGAQLDNLRNTAFPSPFLNYKERGATLEYVRKEPLTDGEAYLVRLKPKTGSVVQCFFDTKTYLLVKMVMSVSVPQLGGAEIEQTTEMLDYRDQDGTKVPFLMKTSSKVQTYSITVTKAEHNIKIDPGIFVKPAGL